MAVIDRWFKTVDGKQVKSDRYGVGKRWRVDWKEGHKRRSRFFKDLEDAEIYDARVKVAQKEGTWVDKEKQGMTVEDLWEPFLATKLNKSESTIANTESFWHHHVRRKWGRRPVREITRAEIEAWLPTLKSIPRKGEEPRQLSASTQRQCGLVLQGILDIAVEHGVIQANPMKVRRGLLPTPAPTNRRFLTMKEVDALRAQIINPQARLLFDVLIFTGVRPGEAKGLKVKDLDIRRKRLKIVRQIDDLGRVKETKTRTHREVPVNDLLYGQLVAAAAGKNDDDWLIPDERGMAWTTTRWRHIWNNACAYCGIEVQTYELRHTAVSIAIASGADIKTVQTMAGHASAAMTLDVYGHLWNHQLDTVANKMVEQMERMRQEEAASDDDRAEAVAQARRAAFRVL